MEAPDELEFVDEEIKKSFKGKQYFIGIPSSIQLAKNIRELTDLMQKPKEYKYKVIQRYGAGWGRITDEDMKLLEDGWELIHVEIDLKKNQYFIQMKKGENYEIQDYI